MVRNRGRYLAPIAIVVVIASAVLIIQGELGSKRHARVGHAGHASSLLHQSVRKTPTFYVVKSGDTLSVISVRSRVPVATLESLNPGLNPNALQTGQRLRLRR
jgi:LysM repeat protein